MRELFFSVLLVLASVNAHAQWTWGEAAHGCRLGIVADKTNFVLGDPISVQFVVTNVTDQRIELGDESRNPKSQFNFKVRNQKNGFSGDWASVLTSNQIRGAVSYRVRPPLKTNSVYVVSFDIAALPALSEPGEYQVIARFRANALGEQVQKWAESAPIPLTITSTKLPSVNEHKVPVSVRPVSPKENISVEAKRTNSSSGLAIFTPAETEHSARPGILLAVLGVLAAGFLWFFFRRNPR